MKKLVNDSKKDNIYNFLSSNNLNTYFFTLISIKKYSRNPLNLRKR